MLKKIKMDRKKGEGKSNHLSRSSSYQMTLKKNNHQVQTVQSNSFGK